VHLGKRETILLGFREKGTKQKKGFFASQCGNSKIFLPLKFYVKSILPDLRRSKIAILVILEAFNFDFWEFLMLSNVEFSLKIKFKVSKMTRFAVFELVNLPNMISRKIRVAVKFLNFHTPCAPFFPHSVEKWKFTLTKKIFRQINSLACSLVKLFSRNFWQKSVRVNFRNFHTVVPSCCLV